MDLPPDRVEYVPDLPINRDCQTYSFHYAPYYSASYRQRAVAIAEWVGKTNPTAVIVDVSAELTQYFRLLGVPVIGVRQHGERTDYPHLAGYDAAYKLLAPFPQVLEYGAVPHWIQDKTIYTPGFSRYSDRMSSKAGARKKLNITPQQQVVVVLNGRGGGKHPLAKIVAAAFATPEWLWLVVGNVERKGAVLDNVSLIGWCEDTYPYLKAADVAIASGGHNTVMEIGTARIPFLCIPEFRPFAEQEIKAQLLAKLGLCLVAQSFPQSQSIGDLFARLKELNLEAWQQIMATDGAAPAARAIESELMPLGRWQQSSEHYSRQISS